MQHDQKDKDRQPDNESVPTPDENLVSVEADKLGERDPDELVHLTHVEEIPTNEEIDADDVVHKTIPVPEPLENTEKDPDDIVHGN